MGQYELCKSSADQKPIGSVCFKNGTLAVAKGTRVYLAEVVSHVSVKPICSISSDDIMKPITGIAQLSRYLKTLLFITFSLSSLTLPLLGVCFYDNHLYISSEDGIIAKSTIPTPTKSKFLLTVYS